MTFAPSPAARKVVGHGMLVLLLGLVAGLGLVFALLESVALWPFPAWDVTIPGSVRGWQAAHVGGIMNGMLLGVIAMLMTYLRVEGSRDLWAARCAIITGWGNTVFYWAGNVAPNRGLSGGDTPYGSADLAGLLAYLGGGIAMVFTFVLVVILARAAFAR